MGLLDLPAPLFEVLDGLLEGFLPPVLRLILWGILAGWITMIAYRRLSNQERIGQLRAQQREQQFLIAEFEGEFAELMPLIRRTLGTGLRQLRLALGPALAASIPALMLVIWIAVAYGYQAPDTGQMVSIDVIPDSAQLDTVPTSGAQVIAGGLTVAWPPESTPVTLSRNGHFLVELPLQHNVAVIHPRRWWNALMANPIGYLPEVTDIERIEIGLPEMEILPIGPAWMRGWMFTFFLTFLLSSVGFKIALRID